MSNNDSYEGQTISGLMSACAKVDSTGGYISWRERLLLIARFFVNGGRGINQALIKTVLGSPCSKYETDLGVCWLFRHRMRGGNEQPPQATAFYFQVDGNLGRMGGDNEDHFPSEDESMDERGNVFDVGDSPSPPTQSPQV